MAWSSRSQLTALSQPVGANGSDAPPQLPLCVGLNDTLLYGNILWEAVLLLVKHQPWTLLWIPFWWCLGRASFAAQVAKRIQVAPEHLPYRQDVLAFIQDERRLGRPVLLTTSAHEPFARPVAEFLGCFDQVMAGWEWFGHAKSSQDKIKAIRRHLGDEAAFTYIGSGRGGLSVWDVPCERLSTASSDHGMASRQVFAGHPSGGVGSGLLSALRPAQWAKNLLLAIPLLMSHQLGDAALWGQLAIAFFAFGFCASAGYVINDLLDLEADRLHPNKQHRPFASGQVAIPWGFAAALVLGLVGVSMAAWVLPPSLVKLLAIYLVLTFAYSLYCKRQLIMDAVVLAGLYTHRIVAGAAAVAVVPSPWLLTFSMFLFLSLAFAKRYAELMRLKTEAHQEARGRGYLVDDLSIIGNLGSTSGYIAVLVFILYLNNSPDAQALYENPAGLWLISPILLYWISRVWLLVRRGTLHEDPVLFTLSDRVSYVCGALILMLILMAANGWTLAL